ncbi:hypothetical protein D8O03_11655, partial [Burkholderia mallei]
TDGGSVRRAVPGDERGSRQRNGGNAESAQSEEAEAGADTVRAASMVDGNQIPETEGWRQGACQ